MFKALCQNTPLFWFGFQYQQCNWHSKSLSLSFLFLMSAYLNLCKKQRPRLLIPLLFSKFLWFLTWSYHATNLIVFLFSFINPKIEFIKLKFQKFKIIITNFESQDFLCFCQLYKLDLSNLWDSVIVRLLNSLNRLIPP